MARNEEKGFQVLSTRITRRGLLVVAAPAAAIFMAACGAAVTPTQVPAKPAAPAPAAPAPAAPAPATTKPAEAPKPTDAAKPTEAPKPAAPTTVVGAVATKPAAATAAAPAVPAAAAKPNGGQPVKIQWMGFSFGQPGSDVMNKQILVDYKKAFPNVTIDYEWVETGKVGERELAGFAAGNMADIWEPYAESIPDVSRTGRTLPLDSYLASSKLIAKADFGQGAWDYYSIGGKLWAIPYRLDVRGWVYRKSHLEAKNLKVPETLTWEQNVQLAKDLTVREGGKLVRAGHSPWESQIRMVQQFVQLLWEAGGEVLIADLSKASFSSPEGEKALVQLIDLHKAVYPTPEAGIETSAVPYFAGGKVSQIWRNPTIRGEMMQYAKDDYKDVVVAPQVSKGPSGKLVSMIFASSWGISPKGQAKNPDATWHALEWVAGNPDQLEKFLLSGGFLPTSKKVSSRPVFQEDPLFKTFDNIQQQWGRQMTPWPRTVELYTILGDELTAAYFGKKKNKEALDQAQKVWNDLIPKAG